MEDIKEKIAHELRVFISYTIYLTFFLGAFTLYRRLLLAEYTIDYVSYSYSIVEAMILAKVIMLGQIFGLGKKLNDWPLIIPTLNKVLVFSCFVVAFSILEHFITGYLRGKSMVEVYQHFLGEGKDEILARGLVMLVAFIPFFAFLEIGRVFGEEKIHNLFFNRKKR